MSEFWTHTDHVSFNHNVISFDLDLSKYGERLKKAQFWLDTQVMIDCEPLMPRQTSTFINITKARSAAMAGSGEVCVGTPPMGRFLYFGKVMVDPVTGSPFARKGVKKVLTDKDLKFWYPGAQAHWFKIAKEQQKDAWVNLVKDILEGRK